MLGELAELFGEFVEFLVELTGPIISSLSGVVSTFNSVCPLSRPLTDER